MSGVVLTPLWSESQTSRQQVTVFGWMQYLSSKHSLNFSIYYGFYQDRLFLAEKWTLNAINLVLDKCKCFYEEGRNSVGMGSSQKAITSTRA